METITVEDIQKGQGYYVWREGESEPYENRSGHLPSASGRTWRVLDIPDEEAAGGMARVIYSNDGLIFLTRDHYRTFTPASIGIFRSFVEVDRPREIVVSNLGNQIDITTSRIHSTVTDNPFTGRPNSSVDILDRQGNLAARRWFGEDGRAFRDVDFDDHGNPRRHPEVPHEHYWKYGPDGKVIGR